MPEKKSTVSVSFQLKNLQTLAILGLLAAVIRTHFSLHFNTPVVETFPLAFHSENLNNTFEKHLSNDFCLQQR